MPTLLEIKGVVIFVVAYQYQKKAAAYKHYDGPFKGG